MRKKWHIEEDWPISPSEEDEDWEDEEEDDEDDEWDDDDWDEEDEELNFQARGLWFRL